MKPRFSVSYNLYVISMVSIKSLYIFFIINTTVFSLSAIQYILINLYPNMLFCTILLKSYIILQSLKTITSKRPYILKANDERTEPFELRNFLTTCGVETASYMVASRFTLDRPNEIYFFIPLSFAYELLFDFFHYWTHRAMHYPFFYKYIHYKHHTQHLINAYTTYNHTLPDLLITNFLPIVATSAILPVSRYTLTTIFWYKAIVEVSGHTGKDTSSSFIQCIYLPKVLGIPLYSRNHNAHHIQPKVNFSKRFSIWDKIFGTFSDATENIDPK